MFSEEFGHVESGGTIFEVLTQKTHFECFCPFFKLKKN